MTVAPALDMADSGPSTSVADSISVVGKAETPRAKALRHFKGSLDRRRQRDKRFGEAFQNNRGWDLMLQLIIARLEDRKVFAAELFSPDNSHEVSIEELDRLVGLGHVILIDGGEDLELSHVALADESARHMVDLFRIATADAALVD